MGKDHVHLTDAGRLPLLVNNAAKTVPSLPAIPRRNCDDSAPLSFAQQQIWLHTELVPEIPIIYNEPVTIHHQGDLDPGVLERSLTEIVRRHEAWRTTFATSDGQPVQVIRSAQPVHLQVIDLRRAPQSQRKAEALRLARADARRPFDLASGPLFRALLVQLGDTDQRLFLTLHHIIFDGYSIYRVLLPELAALFEAFSRGEQSPWPELPVQYPDFSVWQRQWLIQSGLLASQLEYWRRQLGENPPILQLPADRTRAPVQSFRGAIQPIAFSKDLGDALKLLSRHERTSLFMTLLAGFVALLCRYSSLDDVAIGTVSSGRKCSEVEGLLGYFLNPIVLRTEVSGDPTFRELLRRTRKVTLDALSNDDAPFTHVVNEVRPGRTLSCNPLFQVLLTLEPPACTVADSWSVNLTQSEIDTGISKFDLCLELDDRPSGILGRFKYSTDLFDAATVARMADHLNTLIAGIAADPDKRISKLPLLTETERRQVCVQWNNTRADYPRERCLHQLFELQAERVPQSVALIHGNRSLTYRELNDKAEQLAAFLQKRGIGPELMVGICLDPSLEMVVALLGVLKAGGACVPLDPAYPKDWLAHVLTDTQVQILLTGSGPQARLPTHGPELVRLDKAWKRIERHGKQSLSSEVKPENLAYVIHTSGSTGAPKGVLITHSNLVHSTYARFAYYTEPMSRFLLLSSFAFDSSLAGIFSPLCQGGTLILSPGRLQPNLSRLAELIAQNGVTHLLCVPSLYGFLLEQSKPGQLACLKTAIVAGESCPAELVERHYQLLPRTLLFNEYGPTEGTVWSTVYQCRAGESRTLVPIGRPITNTFVRVLDPHLNPVPVGVPGELYIGGAGVARGYLNRSDLTATKFILDPFGNALGERLYKTGDLVRYLPDGNLELLGRLDNQVKIRGFRIELEEIESVITGFKGVRQAVVAVREAHSDTTLVAYLVTASPGFDTEELRNFLRRKLPEVMIPSVFVLLKSLPLMPNGKVDRHFLPAPKQPLPTTECVPPKDEVESRLVLMWESVLAKSPIGVTNNFFDLGGHSLLVAKLMLRIERIFGKKLSLSEVFQAPTIQQLAATLRGREGNSKNPAVVPIQPQGTKPPLFWVRGGPLFFPLAHRLGLDQPLLGLDLPASEASQLPVPYKLEDVAAALVRRMREVQPEGPYYIAGLCVNGVIAYEMASQLTAQGQQVALLALFDAQNPEYYRDFSRESRGRLLLRKIEFHLADLRRLKTKELFGFTRERFLGIRRRLTVLRWQGHYALRLHVNPHQLQDLDIIVHPASYFYRPKPYPGRIAFFQSTNWPVGCYWDFYASWIDLVAGGLEVHYIPGGHESMFQQPNVDVLGSRLETCLSEAHRSHLVVRVATVREQDCIEVSGETERVSPEPSKARLPYLSQPDMP